MIKEIPYTNNNYLKLFWIEDDLIIGCYNEKNYTVDIAVFNRDRG